MRKICDHFGWAEPPWVEPSDLGTPSEDVFCCGYTRHDLLREAAWRVTVDHWGPGESRRREPLRLPVEVPRFRHLCQRLDTGELASYLPVEILAPVVLPGDFPEVTFTVASSISLAAEMRDLATVLHSKAGTPAAEQWLATLNASYTWQDIEDVCAVLAGLADESVRLSVPLNLLW